MLYIVTFKHYPKELNQITSAYFAMFCMTFSITYTNSQDTGESSSD